MRGANGEEVVFKTRVAADDGTLAAQVLQTLSLGLSELRDFEYPWGAPLTVVANGPSAKDAPLDGKCVAINGALRLFTEKGLAPTYWIACDPQELVADFLGDDPLKSTVYLVASKCHPKVFEKLKDRTVIVWHVGDLATLDLLEDRHPVTPFHSVTTCCFEVMSRLGYRDFHVWGWDCCAMGDVENAVAQDNAIANNTIWLDVESKGRKFRTTGTWLHEAQDALSMLKGFPFRVTIHGSGFMGVYAQDYLPMKITVTP